MTAPLENGSQLYQIHVGFKYWDTEARDSRFKNTALAKGAWREYTLTTIIEAATKRQACLAAFSWLQDRTKQLGGVFKRSQETFVKVHRWEQGDFVDGKVTPARVVPFHIFEWKYDRGTTIEQEVAELKCPTPTKGPK